MADANYANIGTAWKDPKGNTRFVVHSERGWRITEFTIFEGENYTNARWVFGPQNSDLSVESWEAAGWVPVAKAEAKAEARAKAESEERKREAREDTERLFTALAQMNQNLSQLRKDVSELLTHARGNQKEAHRIG